MAAKSKLYLLPLLMLAVAGCSSRGSITSWQNGVERYVADRGDPSALRDVTIGTRRGFAVIGNVDPKEATDANGVLLGHKTVDNRPWFIYLVGIVTRQKVTDIHIAAVTFAGGKPQWAMSEKDAHATTLYRHYNEGLWRKEHAHAKPPASYTTFPRDADVFELTGSGTTIIATHQGSGAMWKLDVAKPQKR
jgi:hypothetical protein